MKSKLFTNIAKYFLRNISHTLYVKVEYKHATGHKLNLNNPVRYTEKLQYLRLKKYPFSYDVIMCTDRLSVREYVAKKGYVDTLIPRLGTYNSYSDIDFSELPNEFILKCTHGSKMNLIVKDSDTIDHDKNAKLFKKWLGTNYGLKNVEMHYAPIAPRIIAETLLIEDDEPSPIEYKIHVFNGKAKYMYIVTGRGQDIRYSNFYIDWKPFNEAEFNGWKTKEIPPMKPNNWDDMVKMAEDLAKPFPFVRVDLYNIKGKIYFSEMTFTPAKGTLRFEDDKADFIIGDWLKI